jgi:cytochrome c oxidase subunit 2
VTALYAALTTLLVSLAVIAIGVAVSSRRFPTEAVATATSRVYRARRTYFLALLGGVALALAFTLPTTPYPFMFRAANPEVTVKVGGQMWSWSMASDPGGSQQGKLILPVGKLVEFEVSAIDVNHNFAIYDSTGALVAQVQAMPGYTNRLFHTFKAPGRYYVLCLEYCGIAHHAMNTDFEVR